MQVPAGLRRKPGEQLADGQCLTETVAEQGDLNGSDPSPAEGEALNQGPLAAKDTPFQRGLAGTTPERGSAAGDGTDQADPAGEVGDEGDGRTYTIRGNLVYLKAEAILEGFTEGERLEARKQAALCRLSLQGYLHQILRESILSRGPEGEKERPEERESFTVRLKTFGAERLREMAEHLEREPEEVLRLLVRGMPFVEELEERLNPPPPEEEEAPPPPDPLVPLDDARGSLRWFFENLDEQMRAEEAGEPEGHPRVKSKRDSARRLVLEAERLLEAAETELRAVASLNLKDGREAA